MEVRRESETAIGSAPSPSKEVCGAVSRDVGFRRYERGSRATESCLLRAVEATRGLKFQGFWGYADGSGGAAIVEVDNATTLAKATFPFTPWLRFTTTPIIPIEESAAIAVEAAAARASVGN